MQSRPVMKIAQEVSAIIKQFADKEVNQADPALQLEELSFIHQVENLLQRINNNTTVELADFRQLLADRATLFKGNYHYLQDSTTKANVIYRELINIMAPHLGTTPIALDNVLSLKAKGSNNTAGPEQINSIKTELKNKYFSNAENLLKVAECSFYLLKQTGWLNDAAALEKTLSNGCSFQDAVKNNALYNSNQVHNRAVFALFGQLYKLQNHARSWAYKSKLGGLVGYASFGLLGPHDKKAKACNNELFLKFLDTDKPLSELPAFLADNKADMRVFEEKNSDLGVLYAQALKVNAPFVHKLKVIADLNVPEKAVKVLGR